MFGGDPTLEPLAPFFINYKLNADLKTKFFYHTMPDDWVSRVDDNYITYIDYIDGQKKIEKATF